MTDVRPIPQRDGPGAAPPSIGRQLVWLSGLIATCLGVAGLGAAATASSVGDWYPTLTKPRWTPPAFVFGPVWTVLYVSMAVAAWLVWRSGGLRTTRLALTLFAVQLALNLGWSFVFFGLRRPGLAAIEIILLWLAIAATTLAFCSRSKPAAGLMVPYLAWTTFAAALNLAIWRLN